MLVTDAMAAMGLPAGRCRLGGVEINVLSTGEAYRDGTDTLAGATVPFDECVRRYRKYTGASIVHALEAATLHPAKVPPTSRRRPSRHCPIAPLRPPSAQRCTLRPTTHASWGAPLAARRVQVLGIQARKGSLEVGCDADLTVLDDDLHVRCCYVGGELVWQVRKRRV